MRTVLNEKHGEVLEHLRQDSRALVSMLSALAAHAASETEAGPLLWEMLTDEQLAELAADVGAGPYLAGSLVSSLELASRRGDDEAVSVGTRLIISMLELMPGHRILPHFRDEMVQVVPGVLAALNISDPASFSLSIADILLAVLSPNSQDCIAGSPRDWQVGQSSTGTVGATIGDNYLAKAQALSSEDSTIKACQEAVLGLLQRFVSIGEVDGTSLVRRRRRETSFQFTVMRPRGRRGGGNAPATRALGETASVTDVQRAAIDQAASNPQRPAVAMASTARERRIAFAEEKERAAAAATVHASTTPRLRVGTAELAAVRAVGRLLQGGAEDWGPEGYGGYSGWIGQQFVAHGLGDVCIALLCEFEDREHDLLHCAVRPSRRRRRCLRRRLW